MTAPGPAWMLTERLPTVLLAVAGALLWAAWVLLHRRTAPAAPAAPDTPAPRWRLSGPLRALLRVGLAFAGVWLTMLVLGRILLLRSDWPRWPLALLAVLAAEGLIWLYQLERRVVSRRTGLALVALRLALLGLLVLMLLQPVVAASWTERHKRALAILVDESASMRIPDARMPEQARLRLAESFSLPCARRAVALEEHADALRTLREDLLPEVAFLEQLVKGRKDTARAQLLDHRKGLREKTRQARRSVLDRAGAVEAVLRDNPELPQPVRADLMDAKATLDQQATSRLNDLDAWLDEKSKDELAQRLPQVYDALARVLPALAKVAPVLEKVGAELDAMQYRRLSPENRAAVDAIALLPRLDLARALLLHRPVRPGKTDKDAQDSLLDRLAKEYDVKVFTFAAGLSPADAHRWGDATLSLQREGPPASAPGTAPAATQPDPGSGDEQACRTDLASALRKVLAETGGQAPAGVVVLTDGQDNSTENIEPLARQMGGSGSAFCAVLTGSDLPPTDAAIVSLEAPETVFLSDRMFVDVELKLDGLAGRDVKVSLLDERQPVDTRTVSVTGPVLRTRIQLGDEPKRPGRHNYRVEIEPSPGEVFRDNNAFDLTVTVTDEKTKVLMIEFRPRWEFRYLKNLFSGRDKTIRLQYLLVEPDRITGQPVPPPAPASVSRPEGQEEATTMPAGAEELLKFDVLILGDVPPTFLGQEGAKSIRKFVADRGGTVILIAGPDNLPGRYVGTPLADLIPLDLTGAGAATSAPSGRAGQAAQTTDPALPREGFRIALTPEGADHVICRQDVKPAKSQEIWDSIPPIYWRSRYTQANPACTVLAYALDPDAPRWLTAPPEPHEEPATTSGGLERLREQYQRQHALMLVAPHGLGKVMMLTFDHTWRLRYRVGDTYHHKFWGQVMRWATAGKLPAGTSLVKLGTDRVRYPPRQRPLVRAKIVREDFTPVISDQVAVKVFSRDKLVGRVPMRYLKDSPGLYEARLEVLPAGAYRLELDAPEAKELLARDGVQTVSTEISVDPSAPTEQIELTANRDLPARLAGLSHGGIVVGPHQARRVLRALPSGKWQKTHAFQFELWDSWLLLALFCATATAEWVLRKRVGLA